MSRIEAWRVRTDHHAAPVVIELPFDGETVLRNSDADGIEWRMSMEEARTLLARLRALLDGEEEGG